ncbi:MAG: 30S ribosomal protein S8 [Calditrichaeota bacterium]|nr:30S ribosomal protein S8 [Calditrichota bacterium]
MSVTDPIADYLTRIRNAAKAMHPYVDIPASNIKRKITDLLLEQKYIANYTNIDNGHQGLIRIYLKYVDGKPVFRELRRISTPGLRQYVNHANLPRIKNNMGIAIVSTSNGVMSAREAKRQNLGGEVLCHVY